MRFNRDIIQKICRYNLPSFGLDSNVAFPNATLSTTHLAAKVRLKARYSGNTIRRQ